MKFDVKSASTGSKEWFKAGINENVILKDISRQADKNYTSLFFYLINNGEAKFEARLWDIDYKRIKEDATGYKASWVHKFDNEKLGFKAGEPVTEADAIKDAEFKYTNLMYRILRGYISDDEISGSIEGFGQTPSYLTNAIGNKISTVVRLKLVYNYKDFLSVPDGGLFIEPMSVNPTKLAINAKDKMVKTAEATPAPVHVADVGNDIPF